MAWTQAERPDPNPVSCDHTETAAKIRPGLNQRQREVGSLRGRVRGDTEQNNPTARRQATAEHKFAEIFFERHEYPLLIRAESGDVFIRDAGALFSNREDIPARISQRVESWPRKVLVGEDSHAVLSE